MLSPESIKAFREDLGLSTQELGEIIGLNDAGRLVRGWEAGVRNGHPFVPNGSAGRALHFLMLAVTAECAMNCCPSREALQTVLPPETRSKYA